MQHNKARGFKKVGENDKYGCPDKNNEQYQKLVTLPNELIVQVFVHFPHPYLRSLMIDKQLSSFVKIAIQRQYKSRVESQQQTL